MDAKGMVDLTSWSGMLVFAATTGIIAAVITQVLGIGRDIWAAHVRRQSEGGYLALRLAAILEGYAYACASFINENANAQQRPDEPYPDWNATLPDIPPFPEETASWHSIDIALAGRALDLRNHLAGSQGIINATIEFTEEDLGDDLEQQAADRGQEAWTLARDLRGRYRLSAFVPVWDFTETLESAKRHAKKAKEERAENQAALLREIFAGDQRGQAG